MNNELIKHLRLSRDHNTYHEGKTDIELNKADIKAIIKALEVVN